jgi:HSP20 family protein
MKTLFRTTPFYTPVFDTESYFPNFNFGKSHTLKNHHSFAAANIVEAEKEFEIQLSVAGYSKEELKAQIVKDELRIEGKKEKLENDSKPNFIHKEFSTESFSRVFKISNSLDKDSLQAKYLNGILYVTIQKDEKEIELTQKEIEIK